MLKDFQRVGRELFLAGLNNSHSGNLSLRREDRIVITRKGSMLGCLEEKDLIETALTGNDENTNLASTEICVHRAIFQGTSALAIVHAHPVHAISLSLLADEIIPLDAEGAYLLDKIPVLDAKCAIGSPEVEEKIPALLRNHKIALVRGHGSFASGQTLEEAYHWTSCLENVCRIIYITRTLQKSY
ncbi:MAG: aldolase [Desulfotomaculaceae bacterium]|nr:aldolase [Desulfotomaculaceae bacterium]